MDPGYFSPREGEGVYFFLLSEEMVKEDLFFFAGMAENNGRKHPVLLYIHGESYDWGSGNPYDGSVLASYTDQVIVTMNYRLGVLGFLNANMAPQTKARVANYGLMDQIAALQWVNEHIALFGGDPNNVTLMGQGTGAACVHFLTISPTVVRGQSLFFSPREEEKLAKESEILNVKTSLSFSNSFCQFFFPFSSLSSFFILGFEIGFNYEYF